MNKRKSLILILTIIVSFILIGCNATLEQSSDNKVKDTDTDSKVVSKNLIRTEANQIIKIDKNERKNTNDRIFYEKDKTPVKTLDVSSNINDNLEISEVDNSIVIPENDKSVDNLSSTNKQSDKQLTTKQPIINNEPIKEDKHTEPEAPREETVKPAENTPSEVKKDDNVLCDNAWFDESKPCDYIPENLKPTDVLGREVPRFFTSQEAWDWGEKQIEDDSSKYNCRGFSRMDGYQNDGKQFFFAYLKVCESN